jgi:hypothetical protein
VLPACVWEVKKKASYKKREESQKDKKVNKRERE